MLVNDNGRPVISDFGLSRVVGEEYGGAVRYMATELLGLEDLGDGSHKATSRSVTKSSDVYSFAMVGVEVR